MVLGQHPIAPPGLPQPPAPGAPPPPGGPTHQQIPMRPGTGNPAHIAGGPNHGPEKPHSMRSNAEKNSVGQQLNATNPVTQQAATVNLPHQPKARPMNQPPLT